MRTREQLNKEYKKLDDKIQAQRWVFKAALLSLGLVMVSLFLPQSIGPTLLVAGFLGMVLFGGYCSYLDSSMKQLKDEWGQNGYGLKKYPQVR